MMSNTLFYLVGYPAVGKLTIAKALCAQTGAVLIDNHMINNPVYRVMGFDGHGDLPPEAWGQVAAVRRVLFETMAEHAPQALSYVLTNVLLDDPGDRRLFEDVTQLATRRNACFVPVVLRCQDHALRARISNADRRSNLKETDPDTVLALKNQAAFLPISHPNLLTLDTTDLLPDQSVAAILQHRAKL